MTTRARFIVLLLALLSLAGCLGTDPGPSEYDWCYFFDFGTSSYDVNFIEGSYASMGGRNGLTTDGANRLSASYSHSQIVVPTFISLQFFVEYPDVPTEINVVGEAFGVSTPRNGSGTPTPQTIDIDPYQSGAFYRIPQLNAGDGSSYFNFTLSASQKVQIGTLGVYGIGASPFPENPCGIEVTITPSPIPTLPPTGTPPTPTASYTPSITPTPSITYTPSPTGTCAPFVGEEEFDFTVDDYDYVNVAYNGTWASGQGFLQGTGVTNDGFTNGYRGSWYIPIDIPGTITRIEVDENNHHSPIGTNFSLQTNAGSVLWSGGHASSAADKDFTGLSVEGAERFYFSMANITTWGTGYAFLSATIHYQISCDDLPTGTPSPTLTPSLTLTSSPGPSPTTTPGPTGTLPAPGLATATPTWCRQFDFRTSLYTWILDEGARDAGGLTASGEFDNLRITSPDAGAASYTSVRLTFNSTFSGRAPQLLLASDNTLSTLYRIQHSGFVNPVTLNISFPNVEQFTLDVDRDRFGFQAFEGLRLQVVQVRGTGENPFVSDNCTIPPTSTRGILSTPLPSGTPIPSTTPLATWTLVASQTLAPTSIYTSTPGATLDNLGIDNPDAIPWGDMSGDSIVEGIDITGATGDLLDTGSNVVTFGGNLIGQLSGYMDTLSFSLNLLNTSWNNATPTEIPGLPKCSTQRFAYEVCAIWYILTYTVLSGTVGGLIAPLATFAVYFWIFLRFVNFVVNILEIAARLQRVS